MIVYSACCTTIYVVTWLQSTEWAGLTTGHNASTLSDSGIFSLSVCFPGTPSPHAISRLRVSSIRRHQTTVMTQPTPSSPAMGPRLKTQDNNNNNNNKRGGGDMGDYPCTKNPLCPRMDVARVRGGAGGEPHTDGWITCCCLKRPPRQEKISQCGSSFCLSNGLITKCGRPLCTLVYLFLPFRTRRPVHM